MEFGTIGVDEAGRGPWAGPVVAAAAAYRPEFERTDAFAALRDSKKLPEPIREALYEDVLAHARDGLVAFGVGSASPEEIDRINIRMADRLAMERALAGLLAKLPRSAAPRRAIVDGRDNFSFDLPILPEYLVRADGIVPAVMLASVIAKVTRDRAMRAAEREHPGYGFARHK